MTKSITNLHRYARSSTKRASQESFHQLILKLNIGLSTVDKIIQGLPVDINLVAWGSPRPSSTWPLQCTGQKRRSLIQEGNPSNLILYSYIHTLRMPFVALVTITGSCHHLTCNAALIIIMRIHPETLFMKSFVSMGNSSFPTIFFQVTFQL